MTRKPGQNNDDDLTPEEQALLKKVKQDAEDPSNNFHVWRCETCKDQPEFTRFKMFRDHLEHTHQVPVKTAKVTQQMLSHIDGTKWYQTNYSCKVVDMEVTYTEAIRQERTGEDAMMWMDIG
jgi:hypothetical protein